MSGTGIAYIIYKITPPALWPVTFYDGRFAHFLFVDMDLHALLEKTVTGLGFEVVDIEMSPRARVLRIFIDTQNKPRGVDVEDCATVSNQLSRVLMVENVDYDRLEVSSPGLDRPLTKPAHFERFAGCEVQLKIRVPINGRRNFSGVLVGLVDGMIRLQVDGQEVAIDFAQVEKARLVPRFD